MKRFELLKNGDSIIRVLDIKDDMMLIIECVKKTMPVWVKGITLNGYTVCTDEELGHVPDVGELSGEQKKTMHERYTLMAPVLPFISDEKVRSRYIRGIASDNGLSKQTVRNYLCSYLAYMNIAALAPQEYKNDIGLSSDEKNIRWALNKFFYTTQLLLRIWEVNTDRTTLNR